MWVFWISSLIPIVVCSVLIYFDKKVSYKDWIITTAVALAMAGLFQLIAGIGMTDDVETWSGYVTQPRQYSAWKEYYEYAVYRTEYYEEEEEYTDSEGHTHTHMVMHSRRVFDHWEPTSRWHQSTWEAATTLGNYDIDEAKFIYLCQKFNDHHPVAGVRETDEHNSKMIDGDPNDYVADNKSGWIEPVTTIKHFVNKIKAAPSLFSYTKVPTNVVVYPWPMNHDLFRSDRVMGTAKACVDTLKWDQMNAVLGPTKKVNLIIVGFGDKGMDMAGWQEADWIGGKKNDVVICYGGGSKTTPAIWAKVFGWTEKNIIKLDIQSIMIQNPINDDIIPKIANEIKANYVIKNWHKFDYIIIEPPEWSYWVYFITMIVVQGGLFVLYNVYQPDNSSSNDNNGGFQKPYYSRYRSNW